MEVRSFNMNFAINFQNLLQIDRKKWLLVVGLVALTHMICQSLMLPYGNGLLFLLPGDKFTINEEFRLKSRQSYQKSGLVDVPHLVNASNVTKKTLLIHNMKRIAKKYEVGGIAKEIAKKEDDSVAIDSSLDFVEDANLDNDMPFEEEKDADEMDPLVSDNKDGGFTLPKSGESRHSLSLEQVVKSSNQILADKMPSASVITESENALSSATPATLATEGVLVNVTLATNVSTAAISSINVSVKGNEIKEIPTDREHELVQSDFSSLNKSSALSEKPVRKKMRCELPPKTITSIHQMERLLIRHRARSRAMVEILVHSMCFQDSLIFCSGVSHLHIV